MAHAGLNSSMRKCIEDCLSCYQTCREMAMNHCLETGGRHVEPRHFRLMINCADICRTAADFMLSNSDHHAKICAACAEVCEACAGSCQDVGDMDECVQACRRCAESCWQMAGAQGASTRRPTAEASHSGQACGAQSFRRRYFAGCIVVTV